MSRRMRPHGSRRIAVAMLLTMRIEADGYGTPPPIFAKTRIAMAIKLILSLLLPRIHRGVRARERGIEIVLRQ